MGDASLSDSAAGGIVSKADKSYLPYVKNYYVYILECKDGSFYTGITNNPERRLAEHNSGEDTKAYVFSRRPAKLVWYADFTNPETAIEKEKQIKGWSRAKKEALIAGKFEMLPGLSKKKFGKK